VGSLVGRFNHPAREEFVGPPRPIETTVNHVSIVSLEGPIVTTADGQKYENVAGVQQWLHMLSSTAGSEHRTEHDAFVVLPKTQKLYVVNGKSSPVDVLMVGKKFKVLIKDPKTTRCMTR
jgi:hypothetical protein